MNHLTMYQNIAILTFPMVQAFDFIHCDMIESGHV